MPKPLKFVVGVMIAGLIFSVSYLVWHALRKITVGNPVAIVVELMIQIPVLWGLFQRAPWAWTVVRILAFLGIVLQLLAFILFLFAMRSAPVYALIQVITRGIGLALNFAIFLALGRASVRRFFSRQYDH